MPLLVLGGLSAACLIAILVLIVSIGRSHKQRGDEEKQALLDRDYGDEQKDQTGDEDAPSEIGALFLFIFSI